MDKNNDIQVNKVNKWDYGVVDMSLWHLKDEFDALVDKLNGVYGIDVFEIEELTGDTYSSLDKVLERFNELEAVHHKECGMISQYEEENRNLKSKLEIMTDENDCLITRVFKQDEEYQKLEARYKKLQETDEFHQKIHRKVQDEYAKMEANAKVAELTAKLIESEFDLAGLKKKYEFQKEKNIKLASKNKALGMEISERCKQIHELKDALEKDGELLGEHSKLIDEINRLEKKNEELKKENNNLKQTILNGANLIAVEHDKLLIKYEKLKKENDELKVENNNLTTDNRRLNDAVDSWRKENEKLKDMVKSLRRTVNILDGEGYF